MNKKKRNIFQSIKKDILKGFKRMYFFSYTFLKYHLFSITAFILKKKIQTFKISLLLPTRERSKKFERLLLSLIKTCQYQNRVEILLLLDEDDKEIDRYKEIIKKEIFRSLNFIFIIKNLKSHAIRNNHLAELSTGNIIFPINDDMIFVSKRWDYFIDREFSKIDMDRPFCIWIKSNIKYSYLHCDYPIINKSWHKRLGYVGSENFNFWYLDTWICDLSMRSGRYLITPNIKVDQLSANKFKNEIDETHLRNINSDKEEKDYNIWQKTKGERIKHAKLLN
tara:strand:- start:211 stop:1050 length:840 start_codon:yes stop_codon:yes gene_type:complete